MSQDERAFYDWLRKQPEVQRELNSPARTARELNSAGTARVFSCYQRKYEEPDGEAWWEQREALRAYAQSLGGAKGMQFLRELVAAHMTYVAQVMCERGLLSAAEYVATDETLTAGVLRTYAQRGLVPVQRLIGAPLVREVWLFDPLAVRTALESITPDEILPEDEDAEVAELLQGDYEPTLRGEGNYVLPTEEDLSRLDFSPPVAVEEILAKGYEGELKGKVRHGRYLRHSQRKRPPKGQSAMRITKADGSIEWKGFGNNAHSIRKFFGERAEVLGYALAVLMAPTPAGRPSASEQRRRDTLALIVAEARARGATPAALVKLLGRSPSTVRELAKQGARLAK